MPIGSAVDTSLDVEHCVSAGWSHIGGDAAAPMFAIIGADMVSAVRHDAFYKAACVT